MSEINGNRNMIGGEHYYKAMEPTNNNQSGKGKAPKVSSKLFIAIGAAVAGVVVIGGVAAAAIFNSKPVKLAKAIAGTLEDGGYLAEDIQKVAGASDKCTYSFDLDATVNAYSANFSVDAEGEIIFDGKTKQAYAAASLPGGIDFSALAEINKKEVKLEIPELDDRTFIYNYVDGDNYGLEEIVGARNLEFVNDELEMLYNLTSSGKVDTKEIRKILVNRVKALEYSNAGSETFNVDGKDRKCPGINVVITGDDVYMLSEDIFKYLEKNYSEELEEMLESISFDLTLDDLLENLERELAYMQDYEFTAYLYKGKIAAVEVPISRSDYVQVCFEGGDFRLQNIVVNYVSGSYEQQILSIEGDRDGKVDVFKLKIEGTSIGKFTYNHKTGEFEVSLGQMLGNVEFEGKLVCDSKGVALTMEIPTSLLYEVSDVYVSGDFTIAYKKTAKLHKFGDEYYDIGDVSESELREMAEEWFESEIFRNLDQVFSF